MLKRLLVCTMLLFVLPVFAQENTGGAVFMVNPSDNENLNPLLCADNVCRRLADVLFPWLIGVDTATGTPGTAATDARALADSWTTDDGIRYTLTLRDDLTWSDGQPITAFDVFYSDVMLRRVGRDTPMGHLQGEQLAALLPLDAHTLVVIAHQPTCAALDALHFPVLPAHAFTADFAPAFTTGTDDALIEQYQAWLDDHHSEFTTISTHLYNYTLPVTLAGYTIEEIRGGDSVRVRAGDEVGLYIYNRISTDAAVDYFLNGALDLIDNPPVARWQDIFASDATTVMYPTSTVEYIGFNLADPEHPASYQDRKGNPIDQGVHPILGDQRVREAMRLGIDVPALINVSSAGFGMPLNGSQPPTSWAFDPGLAAVAYDLEAAKRLLDEAGWIAGANGESPRRCVDCDHAESGTLLHLTLTYSATPRHTALVAALTDQFHLLGISIDTNVIDPDSLGDLLADQRYDIVLRELNYTYPARPDQFDAMYRPTEDVLNRAANTSSYSNTELVELLDDASTYPDCDIATRTQQYSQIQRLLNEDAAFVWLFTPDTLFAARAWISNIEVANQRPFHNLPNWDVFYEAQPARDN